MFPETKCLLSEEESVKRIILHELIYRVYRCESVYVLIESDIRKFSLVKKFIYAQQLIRSVGLRRRYERLHDCVHEIVKVSHS